MKTVFTSLLLAHPSAGGKLVILKRRVSAVVLVMLSVSASAANTGLEAAVKESPDPYAHETREQRDERLAWFKDARFGMFIHWGVYSVPAGKYKGREISNDSCFITERTKMPLTDYHAFAAQFNPTQYDPDAWVRLAKDAGMKYIVITTKHHDGFALFETKASKWNMVDATPYGKDVIAPLAEACRKHGMKLGFYYSQCQDWGNPGGRVRKGKWDPLQDGELMDYIHHIAVPQVRELLTNYGDVSVFWWDTPRGMTQEASDALIQQLKLQPGIIHNNRLGFYDGDLRTPEQHIPSEEEGYAWEACMTIRDTWGFKLSDTNFKSTKTLIHNLVDIASKGGNYLLNVGPKSNGEIPQESIDRLKGMAAWMKDNSESIYGTTRTPFARLNWGRCTKKESVNGTKLYLHIFDWPKDGKLELPGLRSKVEAAYFLADMQTPVKIETTEEGATMYLPKEAPDEIDTVVVAKIIGELKVDRILPCQNKDGVIDLTMDDVYVKNRGYGAKIKIETNDDDEKIATNWIDFRANLYWIIRVDEPGEFEVLAEVATVKPTDVVVTGNGKSVKANLPATGSCETFQQISLGKINLSKGEHTITIKQQAKTRTPMSVKSATLKPVK